MMQEFEPEKIKTSRLHSLFVVFFIVSIAGFAYFFISSITLQKKIAKLESQPRLSTESVRVFSFMEDFIDIIIGGNSEVDFETRLKLENKVRAIEDPKILELWKQFVASKNENEAQDRVVEILKHLIVVLKPTSEK